MPAIVGKPPLAPTIGLSLFLGFALALALVHRSRPIAAEVATSVGSRPAVIPNASAPVVSGARAEVATIGRCLLAMDARLPWRENRLEFGWRGPTDCYEAVRIEAHGPGGVPTLFIRAIPKLSRPVIPGTEGARFLCLEDPLKPTGPLSTSASVSPILEPTASRLRYTFPDGTPFSD